MSKPNNLIEFKPISFPEATILLVSDRDRDPLPVPLDKATRTLGRRLSSNFISTKTRVGIFEISTEYFTRKLVQ